MSISEFARHSRLSLRALRLYDEMGLLPPDQVDAVTGYRSYGAGQVETARLIAALRQLKVPLAEIRAVLALKPERAAERIAGYWSGVESEHLVRRQLASSVIERLHGKRSVMYEVETREIPRRSLLCLKRNVEGQDGAWAFGKEFVGLLRERAAPPGGRSWCGLLHLLG
jgi:DNA-binding transcriptional MerR regulator